MSDRGARPSGASWTPTASASLALPIEGLAARPQAGASRPGPPAGRILRLVSSAAPPAARPGGRSRRLQLRPGRLAGLPDGDSHPDHGAQRPARAHQPAPGQAGRPGRGGLRGHPGGLSRQRGRCSAIPSGPLSPPCPANPARTACPLLIFGGSQGSRVLNRAAAATLPLLTGLAGRLEIAHQTGPDGLQATRPSYAESGFPEAVVEAYFQDMPERFGRADLVIARSGATTCAELIAARKASLLVPFAGAAEGHQSANAAALARRGRGRSHRRSGAAAGPAGRAHPLVPVPSRALTAMEERLRPLARPDAAERIAGLCLELMAGSSKE